MTSHSDDDEGLTFIASIEHKRLVIYVICEEATVVNKLGIVYSLLLNIRKQWAKPVNFAV